MLFRLVHALLRVLVLPLNLLRRARAFPRGSLVAVEIDGAVADLVPQPRFWEVWRAKSHTTSLHELARVIDEVVKDPHARGLLVTLKSFRGGMAAATSLRALLLRARQASKDVIVHMPLGGDTKEVYIASVATKLYVGPQALLAPVGFASATRYLRRALDRAGIEPEVFARGKYKSAGEQLVRDTMSEGQKEQTVALLDVFYDEVVEAIASGRGLAVERVRSLVDGAPYRAPEAVQVGLCDGAVYEDALGALLAVEKKKPRVVPAGRYRRLVAETKRVRVLRAPVIGVIQVHGAIASDAPAFTRSMAIDDRVIAAVREARRNPRVRGVVLHVDSPGGGALASDRMHHELVQLAAEKPLVCCMANVAASGGYYVAAAAHSIVAQPTTITGSIGVVAARVVIEPLLTRLGVHTEVLKRGARSDMLQPTRHFDAEEREAFQRELDGMYRAFVGIVAEGRKRPFDEIEALAQGRVWSGKDALAHGLVDRLGGFDVALAAVRARVGGPSASLLEPMILPGTKKAPPPLDPPSTAAAHLLSAIDALATELGAGGLSLAFSREPFLAWCALASRFDV
jgi:protease-4